MKLLCMLGFHSWKFIEWIELTKYRHFTPVSGMYTSGPAITSYVISAKKYRCEKCNDEKVEQ